MVRMVIIGPPGVRILILEEIVGWVQLAGEFDDPEAALRFEGSWCGLVVGAELGFLYAQRLAGHFGQNSTSRVIRVRLNGETLEGEGDPSEARLGITTCSLDDFPAVISGLVVP